MIRAIIVDDESYAREGLKLAIQKFCPEIEIVGICKTPDEGISCIKSHKPDLLFLDVEMPHKSGFNLLEELGDFDFEVIFVTAYNRYAIKAIKFSALDYLLKPLDVDELQRAVNKATERSRNKSPRSDYSSLLKNIKYPSHNIEKLAIPTLDGIVFEAVNDIVYCEADRNYTSLIMIDNRKLIVSKHLKNFENMLSDCGFFRIHNAYLINLKYVKKYVKGGGGYVILEGNHHLDVSKRRKEGFLQMLGEG